jgi:predicted nucleic acid-binding protein
MMSPRRTLYVAEPPTQYHVLPPVVADSSAICALLFEEAERDEARQRLQARELHAPALLDFEFASVALKKHRQGVPAPVIESALAGYRTQPLVLHRVDITGQCALAQQYALSAYDAAYLWLAAELKAPLVTFDRRLGEAAATHLAGLQ